MLSRHVIWYQVASRTNYEAAAKWVKKGNYRNAKSAQRMGALYSSCARMAMGIEP